MNGRSNIRDFLKDEYFVQWVLHPDNESEAYWSRWIEEHPERAEHLHQARNIITGFRYQQTYRLPPERHEQILRALRQPEASPRSPKKSSVNWGGRVAASLLLLILSGLILWHLHQAERPEQKYEEPEMLVKRTQKGEKLRLRLSDGTRVRLNANSVLKYPRVFDTRSRPVQLSGEALFEVNSDPDRPFTISSGEVQTSVLGTAFNVRAYTDEPDIAVAVVSGRVKVAARPGGEVLLAPNEVSRYRKSDWSLSVGEQDISNLIAWSYDILIFDEAPAAVVWKKLEDWYGVEIILPNTPVIRGNYSGKYRNESLERVLDGISYASEFTYEIQNNQQVIIKKMPMENP